MFDHNNLSMFPLLLIYAASNFTSSQLEKSPLPYPAPREDIAQLDEENLEDTINKPSAGSACTGGSWYQYFLYGTGELSAR